jgi:hypothetical protein
MTLQLSPGFVRRILGPESFAGIFYGGAIGVYTGSQPAAARLPATGTLLGYITLGGATWVPGSATNGLEYDLLDTYVTKPLAANWAITPIAAGTAGWFRVYPAGADSNLESTTLPRIDGSISATGVGAQMRIINPVLAVGVPVPIDAFWYTIPPLYGE